MLKFEQLPEEIGDWATVQVEFPLLEVNSDACWSDYMGNIQEYLSVEDGDGEKVSHRSLEFLRTALVAETQFWIWKYCETDGQECYVWISIDPDGKQMLGTDSNHYGLTPQQFMLAAYYNCL